MIKFIGSKSRLITGIGLLFAMVCVSNSCNKSTDNNMYGTNGNSTGTGGTGNAKGPGPYEVFIKDMAFSPSTINVSGVGNVITWTNKDTTGHTITSDAGLFDSGIISPNGTFSYTFTTAGTFTYHCNVHPMMTASVIVNLGSWDY